MKDWTQKVKLPMWSIVQYLIKFMVTAGMIQPQYNPRRDETSMRYYLTAPAEFFQYTQLFMFNR